MRAIYWLRHDLRFHDNWTLTRFASESRDGLIIWCPTLSFLRAHAWRRQFILASVQCFKDKVDAMGGKMLILHDLAVHVIPPLIKQNNIEAIFFSTEPTPEEQAEEMLIKSLLGVQCISIAQGSLIHEDDLPFTIDALPSVFTTFRKEVEKDLCVAPPIKPICELPRPIKLAFLNDKVIFQDQDFHPRIQPGEAAGLLRLQEYMFTNDRLRVYKETRNGMLHWDDSSKLSPWLSCGALSARQIFSEIKRYEKTRLKNESTYWLIFELLWRDYFRFNAQKLKGQLFNRVSPYGENLSKEAQLKLFHAWCEGRTTDAFINANMQELNQTGWMSNRGRQNVASYLVKTMQVTWQWGATYFEKTLIDYDAASNWGNWAYLAGVGQDPRDRIFNPQSQAKRYDPHGLYQKKWLSPD